MRITHLHAGLTVHVPFTLFHGLSSFFNTTAELE